MYRIRSLAWILERLQKEGLLKAAAQEDVLHAMAEKDFPTVTEIRPWFVHAFIGLSTLVAVVFLTFFLFESRIVDSRKASLALGVIFGLAAIGISWRSMRSAFLEQIGLTLAALGQILFVYACLDNSELYFSFTRHLLYLIALEIVLLLFHRSSIQRFVSCLVIPVAIINILHDLNRLHGFEVQYGLYILIIALGALTCFLYDQKVRLLLARFEDFIRPVSLGIAFAFLGTFIVSTFSKFGSAMSKSFIIFYSISWWIVILFLMGLLFIVTIRVALDLNLKLNLTSIAILLLICALVVLPSLRAPGIIAAFIVLLLSFWRRDRLLMGIGIVFLAFYLMGYYYWLEWTLLQKSFSLMGVGLVLLALRFFFHNLRRRVASGVIA